MNSKEKLETKESAQHAIRLIGMDRDAFAEILFDCVVDGHSGIYCGQVFAERYLKGFEERHNIGPVTIDTLLLGPDAGEHYIEACLELDHFELDELRLHIGECGDYFLYDSDLLELWERLNDCEFFSDI